MDCPKMGLASSTEEKNETESEDYESVAWNEAVIAGVIPLALVTRLTDIGRHSLCEIKLNDDAVVGTGFLCVVPVNETLELKGFSTNNQLLPATGPKDIIEISFELLGVTVVLRPEDVDYFFTCHLLDATFIALKSEITDHLLSKGCKFLSANTEKVPPVGSNFYIVRRQPGGEAALSAEALTEQWGFEIRHTVNTKPGFVGSPILNADLQVLAMHRGSYGNKYSRGVLLKYVVGAILKYYPHFKQLPARAARRLESEDINELTHVVKLVPEGSNTLAFVSPESFAVTPIWFRRTHHHWYWTPTDPSRQEANWMEISPDDSKAVIGGFYHGDTPAHKNCIIIDYLKRHGDFYCL